MRSVAAEHIVFGDYIADEATSGEDSTPTSAPTADEVATMKETLEAYKALGNPDEIAELLKDHYELIETAKLSQFTEGSQNKAAARPKSKLNAAQKEEVRNTITELFPGVERMGELLSKIEKEIAKTDGLESKTVRETAKAASKQVAALIDTEGYDKETAGFIEDAVANRIYSNQKLMDRLHSGDVDVVQEVFDKINKEFLSKHVVRKPKKSSKADLADLLAGNVGKSTGGKDRQHATQEELDKMNPNDRMRRTGEDAFDVYTKIANARAALAQHGD